MTNDNDFSYGLQRPAAQVLGDLRDCPSRFACLRGALDDALRAHRQERSFTVRSCSAASRALNPGMAILGYGKSRSAFRCYAPSRNR
ncbi:MAG: hypothetical protein L0H73_17850 [Nitrococcus sp.]|nr:hypothetical protein [Nitrococcus sp.]